MLSGRLTGTHWRRSRNRRSQARCEAPKRWKGWGLGEATATFPGMAGAILPEKKLNLSVEINVLLRILKEWDGYLTYSKHVGFSQKMANTAAILWNTLPVDVQSSPSLPVFRQRLKTFLFHKSFSDVVWQADYAFVDLVMAYCYFSHVKNFLIDWLIDWTSISSLNLLSS